jgi:hypothetical protein
MDPIHEAATETNPGSGFMLRERAEKGETDGTSPLKQKLVRLIYPGQIRIPVGY